MGVRPKVRGDGCLEIGHYQEGRSESAGYAGLMNSANKNVGRLFCSEVVAGRVCLQSPVDERLPRDAACRLRRAVCNDVTGRGGVKRSVEQDGAPSKGGVRWESHSINGSCHLCAYRRYSDFGSCTTVGFFVASSH